MSGHFKDLIAWKKSISLVKAVYRITEGFPAHETYGLKSQLRRAAVSIPSNIAEGQSRFSRVEFRHFLRNAKGSLGEVETQLIIAHELGYINPAQLRPLTAGIEELGRLISGLINSISAAKAATN